MDPELDFGGPYCLFHVKSFSTLLFVIGNTAVRGHGTPGPPGSTPVWGCKLLSLYEKLRI